MLSPGLLAVAWLVFQPAPLLTLEIRAFRGTEEVSASTRITVHRAGERDRPIAQKAVGEPARIMVPAGIYDVQAILEQDARVVSIRWAERLVVMPYPDEDGHHLEVINFTPGFGALQIRAGAGSSIDHLALFVPKDRSQPVMTARASTPYALFVVRAGQYDLLVKAGSRPSWHQTLEVPLDRTRLWIVP